MNNKTGCFKNKDLKSSSENNNNNINNNEKYERKASFKPRVSFSANSASMPKYRPRPSLIEMYTSKRWSLTFLSFTVITMSLTLRMCMSMAIVCMVKPLSVFENKTSNYTYINETFGENYNTEWLVEWDSATQGQVLSSYFYGFPFFCVLGGWAAGKYSGKRVLMIMITTLSVASLAIPYAAITSPYLVIGLRVVVGLASGGLMPCINHILAKWAPLSERSQIIAMATSGQIFGNVVTFALSGIICTIPYQNGWPFIFYIFGILNLLIMVVWSKVVYNHPEDHPRMTYSEINYIIRGRRDSANVKMPDPPWLKIIMSPPFWAIMSAHMSFGFIFTTIGTFLPLYMNDVMKFDTAMNGVVSAVPFIGRLLGTVVSGYLADMCFTRGWMSTRTIRITFQSIGMIGSAPFLCGLGYLDFQYKELAVCLLILYWFIQGASSSGFRVNHLDIAPRFAGVINGMTMTFGSLAAMASPLITSAVLVDRTTDEWRTVFFICVGVAVLGTIFFDCFAQGEEQHWAQDQDIEITIEKKKSISGSIVSDSSEILPAITVPIGNKGSENEGYVAETTIDMASCNSAEIKQDRLDHACKANGLTGNECSAQMEDFDKFQTKNQIDRSVDSPVTQTFDGKFEKTKHNVKNRKSLTLFIPNINKITESSRL